MRLVGSSRKIAMLSASPAMAPTRERDGRRGWSGTGLDGAEASSTTAGGRREAEKIGRSRVAVNDARGIAHKRLPRPADACVLAPEGGGLTVPGTAPL